MFCDLRYYTRDTSSIVVIWMEVLTAVLIVDFVEEVIFKAKYKNLCCSSLSKQSTQTTLERVLHLCCRFIFYFVAFTGNCLLRWHIGNSSWLGAAAIHLSILGHILGTQNIAGRWLLVLGASDTFPMSEPQKAPHQTLWQSLVIQWKPIGHFTCNFSDSLIVRQCRKSWNVM